jgi:chromosomal replication initiation ATPase DnaA
LKGGEQTRKSPFAQLALELPIAARLLRDDFLPAPANQAALAMIEAWPNWPDRTLLIVGPEGSGKSHLAAIFARRAGAVTLLPEKLPAPGQLGSPTPAVLLLDGLDAVADETALFHLLNFTAGCGAYLLMTARRAPRGDSVGLPDLLSRLRRAPMLELSAPDDALLRAVLEKLFRDRQLTVEPGLIDYIALRLERSLGAARDFVADLDREALARGRRVTRALAAELLEREQGRESP